MQITEPLEVSYKSARFDDVETKWTQVLFQIMLSSYHHPARELLRCPARFVLLVKFGSAEWALWL